MPGRPKSGPPYPEVPEVYVVVTRPWGMNTTSRERGQVDFNRVGAWAQLVLREAGVGGGRTPPIDCIYGMGTRDEIIIQFPEGTDIIPLLGEHRWAKIAKQWNGHPDDPRSTCVFIYNWRNHGDPANHNWADYFPDTRNVVVPAKSPYPPPSWTQPPSTLVNFVHSIPRPPAPPPMPANQEEEQQQITPSPLPPKTIPPPSVPELERTAEPEQQHEDGEVQTSASTSLFRPYEPPSQHPSHAQYLNPPRTRDDDTPTPEPEPAATTRPPEPKFVKKLDPYELEEDALRFLKSEDEPVKLEDADLDVKPFLPLELPDESKVKVKVEAMDDRRNISSSSASQPTRDPRRRPAVPQPPAVQVYQASTELVDEVTAFLQNRNTTSANSNTSQAATRSTTMPRRPQPPVQVYHQPHQASAELVDEVTAFLRNRNAAPSDSNVPEADRRSTMVSVKREYEDVELEFSGKRIKIEEP